MCEHHRSLGTAAEVTLPTRVPRIENIPGGREYVSPKIAPPAQEKAPQSRQTPRDIPKIGADVRQRTGAVLAGTAPKPVAPKPALQPAVKTPLREVEPMGASTPEWAPRVVSILQQLRQEEAALPQGVESKHRRREWRHQAIIRLVRAMNLHGFVVGQDSRKALRRQVDLRKDNLIKVLPAGTDLESVLPRFLMDDL